MFEEIFNQENMIELQNRLREHKETLTSAESCTGGLIASMITEISGSSDIFKGSIVTYCNDVKMKEVDVSLENIINYGAVSEAVVSDMCQGALKKFDANYSMAVSGVAGPNGGTEEKPVGTVVVGVAKKGEEPIVKKYLFSGDRKAVQVQSAKTALKNLHTLIFT